MYLLVEGKCINVSTCYIVHLLKSCVTEQQEFIEEMEPFSEEDLAILYPNAQLDNQNVFVDAFIRVSSCCACAKVYVMYSMCLLC